MVFFLLFLVHGSVCDMIKGRGLKGMGGKRLML